MNENDKKKTELHAFISITDEILMQCLVTPNPSFIDALKEWAGDETIDSATQVGRKKIPFTSREDAAEYVSARINPKLGKPVTKFIRNDFSIVPFNAFPAQAQSSDTADVLHCSFCDKNQHQVKKLISGPSVFICDECVELTVDIVSEEMSETSREVTRRHIEFPPEFVDFGINVLSHFATIVKSKYSGQDVSVKLRQDDTSVSLIIRHPNGKTDEIRKTLQDYGDVVSGTKNAESLGLNALQTIELKQRIRALEVQLENKVELLTFKDQVINQLLPAVCESIRQPLPSIQITNSATSSSNMTADVSMAIECLMEIYSSANNELDSKEALRIAQDLRNSGEAPPQSLLDRIGNLVYRLRSFSDDVGIMSDNMNRISRAVNSLGSLFGIG